MREIILKFETKCDNCRKELPVNSKAYGDKDILWTFLCVECYRVSMDAEKFVDAIDTIRELDSNYRRYTKAMRSYKNESGCTRMEAEAHIWNTMLSSASDCRKADVPDYFPVVPWFGNWKEGDEVNRDW